MLPIQITIPAKLSIGKNVPVSQRVRIACTLMGVFGAVFAYQSGSLLLAVGSELLGERLPLINVDLTPPIIAFAGIPMLVSLLMLWACGSYIKTHDAPGPEGWGEPIIKKRDIMEHPDPLWAVLKVWEAGLFAEDQNVHFTTIRDYLYHANIKVTIAGIRSALEINGCKVTRDAVRGAELKALWGRKQAEQVETGEVVGGPP